MALAKKLAGEQSEITDIYSVLSYDELKEVLTNWLTGEEEETDEPAASQSLQSEETKQELTKEEPAKEEPAKPAAKVDDVNAAFNELFNKKG